MWVTSSLCEFLSLKTSSLCFLSTHGFPLGTGLESVDNETPKPDGYHKHSRSYPSLSVWAVLNKSLVTFYYMSQLQPGHNVTRHCTYRQTLSNFRQLKPTQPTGCGEATQTGWGNHSTGGKSGSHRMQDMT
ncbi:hypothetical protein BsWGS_23461 [Bradybaena similaris]